MTVRFAGNQKVLTLNLLGLNQTGPRIVGALSSAAQVAPDQTSIAGDNYRPGPQGRIQRLVLPRPPAPPAQEPLTFSTPNVLLRCDGTTAFTQPLPSVSEGFNIGNSLVKLIAEVRALPVTPVGPHPDFDVVVPNMTRPRSDARAGRRVHADCANGADQRLRAERVRQCVERADGCYH